MDERAESARGEPDTRHFLIKYRLEHGTEQAWHEEIARFISALDGDPVLGGKIGYRCMRREAGPEYFHVASAENDKATQVLQTRDYFKRYTEQTKLISGGAVEVLPLEFIAETKGRA